MRTPGSSAVFSISGKNHSGKHCGLGDARSPGTSGGERPLAHVGRGVVAPALRPGGEDPGFDPPEGSSGSYRLLFGSCDPPLFCGPTLRFAKVFVREINEPDHPGDVLVIENA